MTLVKKHRVQSLLLGMFSFVPYLNALVSVLLNIRFKWKPTNARSKGTITKLLASYILYLAISLAMIYLLVTGALSFDLGSIEYYFWFGVDLLIVIIFIVHAYTASAYVTIPVFEEALYAPSPQVSAVGAQQVQGPSRRGEQGVWQTVDLSRLSPQTPPSHQKVMTSELVALPPIEDLPTVKVSSFSRMSDQ